MAERKVSDLVLKLQQLAKPTFVNKTWRKPAISARRLADMRKCLIAEGVYWPPKPLRDRSKDKPLKLIKHERTREERERKIEENMRNMPKTVAEYRQKVYALRKATRDKKFRSEERKYLIATGQASEGPTWQKFVDNKRKKK